MSQPTLKGSRQGLIKGQEFYFSRLPFLFLLLSLLLTVDQIFTKHLLSICTQTRRRAVFGIVTFSQSTFFPTAASE
jgi:hypothetical protein